MGIILQILFRRPVGMMNLGCLKHPKRTKNNVNDLSVNIQGFKCPSCRLHPMVYHSTHNLWLTKSLPPVRHTSSFSRNMSVKIREKFQPSALDAQGRGQFHWIIQQDKVIYWIISLDFVAHWILFNWICSTNKGFHLEGTCKLGIFINFIHSKVHPINTIVLYGTLSTGTALASGVDINNI